MPALFTDIRGSRVVETDDHVESFAPGVDAEAVTESFFERELLRADEDFASGLDGLNASGHESADVFAEVIVGEEEPLAVDVGKMIGIHDTLLGFGLAWLAVGEGDLLLLRGSLGQGI